MSEAIAGLGSARPGVVLFFPSADLDIQESARAAARAAGSAAVAGLTSNGQIAATGPLRGGCTALALDRSVRVGIGVAEHASADFREAGRTAAAKALAQARLAAGHAVMLLFMDPGSGDYSDAIAGAYESAGPHVPLAGGGAGGRVPAQFAAGSSYTDAVVAVALGSSEPIGVGMAHGCRPRGVPAIVTRARGRTVLQLDGRPAETVYLEKIGRAGEILSDDDFEAVAVVHPLGQPELSGDVRLRHVHGRAPGGGLHCATHIPANAAVEVSVETPENIIDSGCRAVERALEALGGAPPRASLIFDCAGRRRAAGPDLAREVDAMVDCLHGRPPLAGVYTHGEVGRIRGAKGDRNHAVVVVAFG